MGFILMCFLGGAAIGLPLGMLEGLREKKLKKQEEDSQ